MSWEEQNVKTHKFRSTMRLETQREGQMSLHKLSKPIKHLVWELAEKTQVHNESIPHATCKRLGWDIFKIEHKSVWIKIIERVVCLSSETQTCISLALISDLFARMPQ